MTATHLAEMHFVKDDLIWMRNAPKPCEKCKYCSDGKCNLVVPLFRSNAFARACELLELFTDRHASIGRAVDLARPALLRATLAQTCRVGRHIRDVCGSESVERVLSDRSGVVLDHQFQETKLL